jgi:hypothetical protein
VIEREIARAPDSPFLWKALAGKHEAEGNTDEAIECWRALAIVHKKRSEATDIAFAYRKMIQLGCSDPGRLYRDLASLCSQWRRYEEASRACRHVVEAYLAEGHYNAAVGYVRSLPALGPFGESTKNELERLIDASGMPARPTPLTSGPREPDTPPAARPRTLTLPSRPEPRGVPVPTARTEPRFPAAPTRESTAESMRKPQARKGTQFVSWPEAPTERERPESSKRPADEAIFLRGVLGRVTPFDVVQVAENNLVTGRLCVEREKRVGTIHFDKGRIVAATFGAITAHEALKFLLMANAGPFTLELATPDEIPPDEFHAKNNTTLLVTVLRVIDSERAPHDGDLEDGPGNPTATTGELVERNAARERGTTAEMESEFDRWDTGDVRRRN